MPAPRSPRAASLLAVVVLAVTLACCPAAGASAGIAGELESLASSREGVQLSARIGREVAAGSGRSELARLLSQHPQSFTRLQKELAHLFLQISAPRFQELRKALVDDTMGAQRLPELKAFLSLASRSPALAEMARKGEWLQHHPAALQSDLAAYSTLAEDQSVPPIDAKLAAILSRPTAVPFVQGMSPLRIALLLVPGQEATTPPLGGAGRASAVTSSAGEMCEAKAEQVAKRALNGYMAFGEFLFEGVDWAFQHAYGLYLRFGPDKSDLAQTGLHLANHPTHAPEILRDDATDWLLLAEFKAATIDTAARIKNWLHSKGWFVPTGEIQDRDARLAASSKAGASDAEEEGGSCQPANSPANPAPEERTAPAPAPAGGNAAGGGPLHWTGTMRYKAKTSSGFFLFEFGLPASQVEYNGEAEAVWNIDARTPERGINPNEGVLLDPGEDMNFPLTYTGSWHVHLQYHWFCFEGSRSLTQELTASGSGGPPPNKGSYLEEVGLEIVRPGSEAELRFVSTPAGTETYSGEGCIPAQSGTGVSWIGGLTDPNFWQPRLLPDECLGESVAFLSPPIFNAGPGRIVGGKPGSCGSLEWDLTVLCPDDQAPSERFTCPTPAVAASRADDDT
jgi:hypothetical protein